jgi:hypothetical protein
MVKTSHTTRTYRAQNRELAKLKKELAQTTQNAKAERMTIMAGARRYVQRHKLILAENNILRQSLKNFQIPYYKLKRENRTLKRGIRAIRNATNKTRAQKRRNLKVKHPKAKGTSLSIDI